MVVGMAIVAGIEMRLVPQPLDFIEQRGHAPS